MLADTWAALALARRELPLSPPRVVCRLSVAAAAGHGAPHIAVQLLPDRYCEVMTAVVQVGALQLRWHKCGLQFGRGFVISLVLHALGCRCDMCLSPRSERALKFDGFN